MGRLAEKAIANLKALSEAELDALVADAIAAASQSHDAWPADAWLADGVNDMGLQPFEYQPTSELTDEKVTISVSTSGTRYSPGASEQHRFVYRPK